MADKEYSNRVETVVEIDSTQAQIEIAKLNAIASDSTKTLEQRIEAKNKQVEIQNKLSAQTIKNSEDEVSRLESLGSSEKEIESATKRLNSEKVKATKINASNQKAINKLTTSLGKEKEANSYTKDSVVAYGKQLSMLTKEYDRGDKAMREKLLPRINELKGKYREAKEASGRFQDNVGNYPNKMGAAGSAIKSMDGALGGVLSSMKAFVMNPIGAVITLLVGAFQLIKKALNSTEDGAASFNAIMAAIGQVFTNIVTFISDAVEPIFKKLADFLAKNMNPIMDAFGGYVDAAKLAFKAWIDGVNLALTPLKSLWAVARAAGKAISGDFDGAKKVMTDFKDEVVNTAVDMKDNLVKAGKKVVSTTKDISKGFDGASKSAKSLISVAAQIELTQNQLNKDKRVQLLNDAKLEVKSKKALADSKDLNLSYADRFKRLKDFKDLEIKRGAEAEKILKREISLQRERMSLGGNTKEDEEALNNLLIKQEKLKGDLAKQDLKFNSLSKEFVNQKKKAAAAAAKKESDLKKKAFDEQVTLDELEIEQKQAKGENTLALEEALLTKQRDKELENTKLTADGKQIINEQFALDDAKLHQKYLDLKDAADKKQADIDKQRQEAKKKELNDNLNATKEVLGTLFGDSKAAAIAIAVINMLQGITADIKLGFPAAILPIAATTATGISTIRKITATKPPSGLKGSTSGGSVSIPSKPALPNLGQVSDLTNVNNSQNSPNQSTISNSAIQTASAKISSSQNQEVVFSEGKYKQFQNRIAFKENKSSL